MNKFKIGDKVIHKRMDIIGTIRVIDDTSLPYGVEFDDKISGLNNLQGLCEIGHGLWVSEEDIELEKEKGMEMNKFKVGDRVKYIGTNSNYKGKVGTIITIDDDSIPYGIEFDEKVHGGHSLDGECEYGYGKWFELEEIELINPTLEDYTTKELEEEFNSLEQFTDEQLKTELDKRERAKVIKELRKYIDKPVNWDELPEYTNRFDLFLADDKEFQTYCDAKTTEELKEELKNRKENEIHEILEVINNNIKKLRELGYTIPYKDNTIIDSLELNKVFDKIGVFYK